MFKVNNIKLVENSEHITRHFLVSIAAVEQVNICWIDRLKNSFT